MLVEVQRWGSALCVWPVSPGIIRMRWFGFFFHAVPSPVPSWQLGSGLRTQTAMTIGIKGSSAFVTAAKLHFSNRLQLSAV